MNYERLKEWWWSMDTLDIPLYFVGSRILHSLAAEQAKITRKLETVPFVDVGPALKRLVASAPGGAVLPYVALRGQPVNENTDEAQGYFNSTINGYLHAFTKIGKSAKLSPGSDLLFKVMDAPSPFGLKGGSGMIVEVAITEDAYNVFQELQSNADGLTVFGRVLKLTNDRYIIEPSLQSDCPYVLSESLEFTLKIYKYASSVLKFTAYLTLGIGISLSLWKLWDLYKLQKKWKWEDFIERERQEMEADRQRRVAQAQYPGNAANNAANNEILGTCVVCLSNPRQLMFIPCGHIVCCFKCAARLRETCPVCKTRFTHTHAAFLS